MNCVLCVTILLALLPQVRAQQAAVRPATRVDRGISVAAERRSVTATVRSFDLDVVQPGGKQGLSYVSILYDPASRSYFWLHYPLSPAKAASQTRLHTESPDVFSRQWTPFLFTKGIALFWIGSDVIVVVESSALEKANTLAEAEDRVLARIREIGDRISITAMDRTRDQLKYVSVRQAVGLDFVRAPLSPINTRLKLLSITKMDSGWELVVECRWKERLILTEDFRLLSHQRIQ